MYPGNVVFTTSLQEPGYTGQDLRQTQAYNEGQEDHQEFEQVHAVNQVSLERILSIVMTKGGDWTQNTERPPRVPPRKLWPEHRDRRRPASGGL